jgi:hypothetical protein
MIDNNHDLDPILTDALCEPPPTDEGEMTSIMGEEERRLLQRAARQVTSTASDARQEELKETARPPSSGAEPAIVIPKAPLPEPGRPTPKEPEPHPRSIWPILAFLALAAAVWFAVYS